MTIVLTPVWSNGVQKLKMEGTGLSSLPLVIALKTRACTIDHESLLMHDVVLFLPMW